jgi:radical SAM protein with 4Fe4S-binding SPASM domain
VTPAGKVLPCHAAESITGLEFWNVRERSLADIWSNSPAFNAFRGSAWMKEPCASCPRRELDFGGCRCQAFALTGDAAATDPVCHLAPDHARVAELAAVRTDAPYVYRRMKGRHQADVGNQALSTRREGGRSTPSFIEEILGSANAHARRYRRSWQRRSHGCNRFLARYGSADYRHDHT